MYAATGADPTNDTAATSGCVSNWLTASLAPWTTLKTPSGSPASCNSSAIRIADNGVSWDGLSTKVLPVTIATGIIQSGPELGNSKGGMPAPPRTGNRY